jgi:hypothetical protein
MGAVPDLRTLLAGLAFLALLVVLAVVRAAYDEGPTPEQQRCQQLRAEAGAVAEREDTVDDELEYLRRARAADNACR